MLQNNSPIGPRSVWHSILSLLPKSSPMLHSPSICRNNVSTHIFLSVGKQWSGIITEITCVTSLSGWICAALKALDRSALSVVKGYLWLECYKHFNNCEWLYFFDSINFEKKWHLSFALNKRPLNEEQHKYYLFVNFCVNMWMFKP